MEAELESSFLPALIERSVIRHTGKGLRRDCGCSYCQEKIKGTWDIAYASHGSYRSFHISSLPPTDGLDEGWAAFKERAREKQRVKLRAKLTELKQQVL